MSPEPMESSRRLGVCLDPLDVLFFRDGRPFDAASRAYGGLPNPRTIAGALRTAMLRGSGFDFARLRSRPGAERRPTSRELLEQLGAPIWALEARLRGPWLSLMIDGAGAGRPPEIRPLLPVPATLARIQPGKGEGEWSRGRARTKRPPGWPDDGLRPFWRDGDPQAKHPGGHLTLEGIRRFLGGGMPDDSHWYRDDELFGYDVRTGIRIDADTQTVAQGQIYGARMLALRHDVPVRGELGSSARVVLYEEVILTKRAPSVAELKGLLTGPIPLGGEGRHAASTLVEPVEWPTSKVEAERSLWLMATPGIFGGPGGDRRPDRPDAIRAPARLVAAASGGPQAVSGWDVARGGPRPTRFAVPAGAVYGVEGDFRPAGDSLCSDPELVQEGWGYALRGAWNDG